MSPDGDKDPRTYAIIGAVMAVHRELGCGFLEPVYHEAMALELAARAIPYQREVGLAVFYKGQKLTCDYRADLLCFGSVVVELKAVGELSSVHQAQVINYLKATGLEVGLLINFGAASLQYKRFVLSKKANRSSCLPQSVQSAESADHQNPSADCTDFTDQEEPMAIERRGPKAHG